MKKNYDRVLMIATSVIAILVSGFIAFKSFGFADNFTETATTGKNNPPPAEQEKIENSISHLGKDVKWVQPAKQGQPLKTLRLLRSVALVQKAGNDEIIDLDSDPEGELRPPIKNWYLRKYNLAFTRDDVNELDPDGDGFNNAEEFLWGKTDAKDKEQKPPYWRKLELAGVKFEAYSLEFKELDGKTFSLRREREEWKGKTIYAELNEKFRPAKSAGKVGDEDRFTITNWDEGTKEITIQDDLLGKEHKVVAGDTVDIPYKKATLNYTFPGSETTFEDVREGEIIDLPDDDVEYLLKEVSEDEFVRISFTAKGEQNPKVVRIPEN